MIRANYVLLDSAKMDSEMAIARELNPEHTCLYEGDSERFLGVVAPWLFDFQEGTEFTEWVSVNAKGNDWGIFLRSEAEPIRIYRHLRKFLIVQTEDGKELYFRFYDPRVLRVFLPTCDREQLKEFFGPIDAFIAEDENGLLVEYAYHGEELAFRNLGEDMKGYFNNEGVPKPTVRTEQIPGENQAPIPSAPEMVSTKEPEPTEEPLSGKKDEEVENEPPEESPKKSRSGGGWDFGY